MVSPAYGPAIQVVVFFLNTIFLHMLTAHAPLPEPVWQGTGQAATMVLSPVSAGVSSFTSILCFIKRLPLSILSLWKPCVSVGLLPIAIRIPVRFVPLLDSRVWKPVRKGQPTIDLSHGSAENYPRATAVVESPIFSLSHTACVKGHRFKVIEQYSYFPKFQAFVGFLQVSFSIWQAYTQYLPLFLERGLAAPVLVAVPALSMSFLNMIANLLQTSYTHIIIMPPLRQSLADNPTTGMYLTTAAAAETTTEFVQVARSTEESVSGTFIEFDNWFRENHPDIEINEEPNLQMYAFFGHHSLAILVHFLCLALLTNFRSGSAIDERQIALFSALFLDPVCHILLAIWQCSKFGNGISRSAELGIVHGVKIVVWVANVYSWYVAGKMLYEFYSCNSNFGFSDGRST